MADCSIVHCCSWRKSLAVTIVLLILTSSANWTIGLLTIKGISLTWILKRIGRALWYTTDYYWPFYSLLFKTTFCFLPTRKFLICSKRYATALQLWDQAVVWNRVTSISKVKVQVWPVSSAFFQSFIANNSWVEQDLPEVNPCCCGGIILLTCRCSWMLSLMIDSIILQMGKVRLIGR